MKCGYATLIRKYVIPLIISVALSRIFLTNVLTLTTLLELRMIACTTFVRMGNFGLDMLKGVLQVF